MTASPQAEIARLIDWIGTWFLDESQRHGAGMTDRLHPYDRLFSPIRINALDVKNRVVMGPMGNLSMADETGRPSGKMIAYFAERARGGVGLIISGLVPVAPGVDPSILQAQGLSCFPRIDGSRSALAGWRDLADSIHAHGARFFVQLSAGLGRVGSPECAPARWRLPVSASWNPNFYVPQIPCRPLTDRECRKLVRAAGQAAADAKACGIDGVQLHGHEGYLLEQFANTAFNRRRFGRYADWQAFGLDMVTEIRRRCGPLFPIMYRIDLALALGETYGERINDIAKLRRFRNERSVAMSLDYIRNLIAAGVDIVDIDLGCYENWWLPHPPTPMPPGSYLGVAKLVKDFLETNGIRSNTGHPIPVAAVGKLGYPDLAEGALRNGDCDMIMLARPLLADPDWPRKAFAGRVREITPCIGDHEGCLNEIVHGGHLKCAVNPRAGFEDQAPAQPLPTTRRRRIAVIGAGPAGITCACLAARRGHAVVLFERQTRPGGWLRAGSMPAIKYDVANFLVHLEDRLQRSVAEDGLELRLSAEATPDLLLADHFDAVVCCTGSSPIRPAIAGSEARKMIAATDLLLTPSLADSAKTVVVIGGGDVGCETAHMLAYEYGKTVTVIESSPYFMGAACTANRGYLIHYLEKKGVALWNCSRVERVADGVLVVARNLSPTVPSPFAVWDPVLPANIENPFDRKIAVAENMIEIAADLVVVATGLHANDGFYRSCVAAHVAAELHNIGDSFRPGRILEATRSGHVVGVVL